MKVAVIGLNYEGWETDEYKGKTETVQIPKTDDIELAIATLGEAEYHALAMRALRTAFVNYSNRVVKEGNYAMLHKWVGQNYPTELAATAHDFSLMKNFVLGYKDEFEAASATE